MAAQSQDSLPTTHLSPSLRTSRRRWPEVVLSLLVILIFGGILLLVTGCKEKGQENFSDLPDIGKLSLGKWDVPVSVIEEMKSINNKPTTGSASMSGAEKRRWASPDVALQEKDGPFMAVLVMEGVAQAAGTRAQYELAWDGLESSKPGMQHATIVSMLNIGHYGERGEAYPAKVRKAVTSVPFRIEKPQKVRLVVSAEQMKGLVPERMTLELRAGVGTGGSFFSRFMQVQWFLLGFVMLFVWWWLFKRER